MKLLLSFKASCGKCNKRGEVPLHLAAARGFGAVCSALLEAGANPNLCDGKGQMPLHHFCSSDGVTLQGVRNLVEAGVGMPIIAAKHENNSRGLSRRERLLFRIADLMDKGLREALRPRCLTFRGATAADILETADSDGNVPLHCACGAKRGGEGTAARGPSCGA